MGILVIDDAAIIGEIFIALEENDAVRILEGDRIERQTVANSHVGKRGGV